MEILEILHVPELVLDDIVNLMFKGSLTAMTMGFITYLIGFCIMKIWNGIDSIIKF